jgi:4-diphosphocytidyl-2C-methyl-D-erythritol kinase
LSGSGASIFAVAESHSHALKLKELISNEFPDYYVCVAKTV